MLKNQAQNAIAAAASYLVQLLAAHWFKSSSMRVVIPANAHPAENVIIDVICNPETD